MGESLAEREVAAGEQETAPRSLWRNRDYMILWSGQAVSSIGTQVSRLAFPLFILALTGSPAQAGLVSALASVPYILLALLAGSVSDRRDRKRIMVVCDTIRAAALASIVLVSWTGHLTLAQLYIVAVVDGTGNVFFDLAEIGALPRVVVPEQLPTAMAQNNATFSISSLIGQPLGGALFQIGRVIPFLVDSVSYVVSVLSLLFIRTRFQAEPSGPLPPLRVHIGEGLTWLWSHSLIRFMAFLNAAVWITLSGNYLVIIVIAQHQHASPATIGIITASTGVGGIAGAFLMPRAQRWLSFTQVVVGGMLLSGVLWALYAVVPNPVALGAVAAAGSLVFTIYNVVQMSYRIALIPNEFQGRVNSLFRLIAFTGQPIGLVLTGVLLQTIGVAVVVVLGATWFGLLAIVSAMSPAVRSAHNPSI